MGKLECLLLILFWHFVSQVQSTEMKLKQTMSSEIKLEETLVSKLYFTCESCFTVCRLQCQCSLYCLIFARCRINLKKLCFKLVVAQFCFVTFSLSHHRQKILSMLVIFMCQFFYSFEYGLFD